ncbi:hypothetical protein ITJ55_07010 [Frigoribacterium sp. VKM Ac-1396]|uniref:hypothetical protein n=1 Tax=Frigoribacterium sp. VKM Ac-1396 TaxID=2783821 RepID=UPI00188D5410|nr:hypothetical protein [Frigoribacterium sp. VKM Ac-1396]MBF4600555.1 hypothetical protein [Frigoribacterium sp. VKM Ac-1396]
MVVLLEDVLDECCGKSDVVVSDVVGQAIGPEEGTVRELEVPVLGIAAYATPRPARVSPGYQTASEVVDYGKSFISRLVMVDEVMWVWVVAVEFALLGPVPDEDERFGRARRNTSGRFGASAADVVMLRRRVLFHVGSLGTARAVAPMPVLRVAIGDRPSGGSTTREADPALIAGS